MKVFLTLFCLFIISFTATGLIVASINAGRADGFLSDASYGIAAGNFRENVIGQWQREAEERGYDLEASPKDTDGDGFVDVVDLKLVYPYVVPFLKMSQTPHVLRGYAR